MRSLVVAYLTTLCVVAIFLNNSANGESSQNLDALNNILQKGYDRRVPPMDQRYPDGENKATRVACQLFINSMGDPNALTMDYKVDFYLIQKWRDERLRHDDLKVPLGVNDPSLLRSIWKPDVYFPNAKDADFQFVTVPNAALKINPNGDVTYMLRLRATFSCFLDLRKFPHDSQTCRIEIEPVSTNVEEMVLEWQIPNPVVRKQELGLNQLQLKEIGVSNYSSSFGEMGMRSCLLAELEFSRPMTFHFIRMYVPMILMVLVSWISFWLGVKAVSGRIILGVTSIITIFYQANEIQQDLLPVPYVKAIDVWIGTCIVFVIATLLEFATVNFMWRQESQDSSHQHKSIVNFTPLLKSQTLDTISKIGFPCAFILFNAFYWNYYFHF